MEKYLQPSHPFAANVSSGRTQVRSGNNSYENVGDSSSNGEGARVGRSCSNEDRVSNQALVHVGSINGVGVAGGGPRIGGSKVTNLQDPISDGVVETFFNDEDDSVLLALHIGRLPKLDPSWHHYII